MKIRNLAKYLKAQKLIRECKKESKKLNKKIDTERNKLKPND
jgi:hypothetical protein